MFDVRRSLVYRLLSSKLFKSVTNQDWDKTIRLREMSGLSRCPLRRFHCTYSLKQALWGTLFMDNLVYSAFSCFSSLQWDCSHCNVSKKQCIFVWQKHKSHFPCPIEIALCPVHADWPAVFYAFWIAFSTHPSFLSPPLTCVWKSAALFSQRVDRMAQGPQLTQSHHNTCPHCVLL